MGSVTQSPGFQSKAPGRCRPGGAVGGRLGHHFRVKSWGGKRWGRFRGRGPNMWTANHARLTFEPVNSKPPRQSEYISSGTHVKLLLRVACIDVWSHREGAPGLSKMYFQCQADQSFYSNMYSVQGCRGYRGPWSSFGRCLLLNYDDFRTCTASLDRGVRTEHSIAHPRWA